MLKQKLNKATLGLGAAALAIALGPVAFASFQTSTGAAGYGYGYGDCTADQYGSRRTDTTCAYGYGFGYQGSYVVNPTYTSTGGGSTGGVATLTGTYSTTITATNTNNNNNNNSCSDTFTKFTRKDRSNDVAAVKKLQAFLNEREGAKLPVTGFFGSMTQGAVKKFQAKYGISPVSGHQLSLTTAKLNELVCKAN